MHHIRHKTARKKTGQRRGNKKCCNFSPFEIVSLSLSHTQGQRCSHTSHCLSFVLTVFPPSNTQNYSSVPSIKTKDFIKKKKSCSSPLGGLPHPVAVVSVEVGGQVLLLVHTVGLHHIREAQRPEGQRLHGLLNQLDMTSSTCGVCLDEDGEDTAPSRMSPITPAANDCAFVLLFLCMHEVECPLLNALWPI